MARFLFTMLFTDDLGLAARLVPIAYELATRGHSVAVCNPAPIPAKLIAESGLAAVPVPRLPRLASIGTSRVWDADCLFANIGMLDESFTRMMTALHIDVIRDYDPDIVVDSFSPFACLAARICRKPLVTVLQGDFHPASRGFIWWEESRPSDLPDPAAVFSRVATGFGCNPVARVVDVFAGDLILVVGTPETDPLPPAANAIYVGPILWHYGNDGLPQWVMALRHDRPLVWLYPGNPRYGVVASFADSVVLIRAAVEALGNSWMRVLMTSGYQTLPAEVRRLPENFMQVSYLPGLAMAKHSDLMIHHGGHGSFMTGLQAGTPQVIVPTYSERESSARRMAALGVGEFVVPTVSQSGKKQLDITDFKAKVHQVLTEPRYREAAHRIAGLMRRYGGAREAADRIERFGSSLAGTRLASS
ncbi:MAG: glycosyltransferase family 1 protein [Deltaproteobacteria bacterium]|nr:glycosyltransferase family 1 protein [Deltaproteobacteria bacterium]